MIYFNPVLAEQFTIETSRGDCGDYTARRMVRRVAEEAPSKREHISEGMGSGKYATA